MALTATGFGPISTEVWVEWEGLTHAENKQLAPRPKGFGLLRVIYCQALREMSPVMLK